MELYLAYSHPDTNLWYNLGWTGSDDAFFPMLSGPVSYTHLTLPTIVGV